jgi:hypothetical protein
MSTSHTLLVQTVSRTPVLGLQAKTGILIDHSAASLFDKADSQKCFAAPMFFPESK